jgi:hypothetical protein
MYCSITLSPEEFKILHNSLCDLNGLACRHPEVEAVLERIRKVALKSAYEQESEAFNRKWKQYDHWKDHYGLTSTWSIYEVDNMTLCHPYTDAEYVVYDNHWGDSGEVVRRIEGRDWNALYRAADSAIQASGDSHHSFIESFTAIEDRPGHLRLGTGS